MKGIHNGMNWIPTELLIESNTKGITFIDPPKENETLVPMCKDYKVPYLMRAIDHSLQNI